MTVLGRQVKNSSLTQVGIPRSGKLITLQVPRSIGFGSFLPFCMKALTEVHGLLVQRLFVVVL